MYDMGFWGIFKYSNLAENKTCSIILWGVVIGGDMGGDKAHLVDVC
jgi:hypothetical protein